MLEQFDDNQKAAMIDSAQAADLSKPITKEFLENLSLEAIKAFRDELFNRVQEIIREDLGLVHSTSGREALPKYNPYRLAFYSDSPGGNRLLVYKGVKVYSEESNFVVPGKWIAEIADWANQIRAEFLIRADKEKLSERDRLILDLTVTF